MTGEGWSEEGVRVAVVKTALKDVARELLLSVYSKGEGSRSSSPRSLVDKAVDMALAESSSGEGSGQGRFMQAMNTVWNEYYQGITFESLVSEEEREKVRRFGSIEAADEAAQASHAQVPAEGQEEGGEESELSDLSESSEEEAGESV
ncbi:hypothetical protein BCR44DRAFT_33894 [Catenaria anguillulae PL171]|uniref:Uncharacterized protein n=1 Tax=Catenaria anguillulae PL171 TaxID=765915 RepID=A0A1Y2HSE1_9FUNG|nr:hypothetical protein BCR44DRAFT_33894 [Catenaria anguillulae PL171]